MKNGTISSRASIVQRSKGQSAVEQSAYISRTSLYSDYYGIQRNSSRVATDLARLSVFKGNLREMEAQQRADEQTREQNPDKKHENTI